MKKFIALAMAVVFLGVTGCGSGTDTTNSAQETKKPIRIGVVAGTSGSGALSGQMEVNGAKLAAEEINSAGGVNNRQIELVVEDSQSTNPGAVAAFQKVAGEDVSAIVGPIFSTAVQAILPYMEKYKLPVLVGGTDATITASGNPWVFRVRPSDAIATKVMLQYMVNDLKAKKIAIVHDTDAFGSGVKKGLEEAVKDYSGAETKAFGLTSHSGDYTAQIVNVKQYSPDVIVILSPYPEDGAVILRQIKELGLGNVPKLASAAVASANTIKLAKDNADGMYGVTDFFPEQNEKAKNYAKKFKEKYNASADIYSAYAYDAIHLLAKIIAKDGDASDKIHQSLKSFSGWSGVEGDYAFDSKGDGLFAYSVIQIKGGEPTFVKVVKTK